MTHKASKAAVVEVGMVLMVGGMLPWIRIDMRRECLEIGLEI